MKKIYQYDEEGLLLKSWKSIAAAANQYDIDESAIRKAVSRNGTSAGFFWSKEKLNNFFESDLSPKYDDILYDHSKLEYSLQKSRDTNRISRAKNRTNYRFYNLIETLSDSLEKQFESIAFTTPVQEPNIVKNGKVFIVQISDAHFNEEIDLPHNRYDFFEASKRMQKLAYKIKSYAGEDLSKIIVAMTGDMINSDRRLDEMLNMSTNRMKASLLATSLLSYFIKEMATIAPVEVVAVTGNESRIHDEWGLTDKMLTDNYDFLIFNMLKAVLKDHPYITFMDSNPKETVVEVNGLKILITHGEMYKQATQDRIQKTFGRYAARGINLDYIIFGHIHFANIGDIFARSGSISGSNTYSEYGIDLVTKASQNLHIIYKEGEMDNIRMDIHNTNGFPGYPLHDDVDAYNALGNKKVYKKYTVIVVK